MSSLAFLTDKATEMTLEGDDKKEESGKSPVTQVAFPLVGGRDGGADQDSDSDDSGPIGDIDDYELEEDDPVSL